MKADSPQPEKTPRLGFRLAFLFSIVQGGLLLIVWSSLPPQLPLFYSRPWGEEQLTTPLGIFFLPGLSLAITLVNLVISRLFFRGERLIGRTFSLTTAIFSLLCLITLIKIIRLVT